MMKIVNIMLLLMMKYNASNAKKSSILIVRWNRVNLLICIFKIV